MAPDPTVRFGGAVVMVIVFGLVLGVVFTPTAGIVAGAAAGAGWLGAAALAERSRRTPDDPPR